MVTPGRFSSRASAAQSGSASPLAGLGSRAPEQSQLQRLVGDVVRQRPRQAGRRRTFQIVLDGRARHAQTPSDLPRADPAVVKSQERSQLSHAQFPLRRHPSLLVDHRRAGSASVADSRGADAGRRSRLKWPASFRNGGRLQIGTAAGFKSESVAGLRRNSHVRRSRFKLVGVRSRLTNPSY